MSHFKKFEPRAARLSPDAKAALEYIHARSKGTRKPKLSRVQRELVRVADHDPKPVVYEDKAGGLYRAGLNSQHRQSSLVPVNTPASSKNHEMYLRMARARSSTY
jgi:hypothetical protein